MSETDRDVSAAITQVIAQLDQIEIGNSETKSPDTNIVRNEAKPNPKKENDDANKAKKAIQAPSRTKGKDSIRFLRNFV